MEHTANRPGGAGRVLLVAAIAFICLGSFAVKLGRVSLPFVETHAWVSAHFSIMARNYVEHGFWRLRGAPVQSTGPLEPRPDYYLHWPFLFQVVLALWYKLWGVSEWSGRLLAAVISTATAGAVASASWRGGHPMVAVVAAAAAAFMPSQLSFGASVLHLLLAVACWSAAVQALVPVARGDRRDTAFLVWAALGMLTSWEICLGAPAPLALWAVYGGPALRRTGVRTLLLAASVVGALFAFTAAVDPGSIASALSRALWRAGLSSARPEHWFPGDPAGIASNLRFAFRAYVVPEMTWPTVWVAMLGAAVLGLRAARRRLPVEMAAPAVAFALPPALWYLLMPRHIRYHDYELVLAVPFVATMVAWGVVGGTQWLRERGGRMRLAGIGASVLLAAWAASGWHSAYTAMTRSVNPSFKEFGEALRRATAPSDRILTDIPQQTIDYYADRRIYRVACDLDSVDRALAEIDTLPGRVGVFFAAWAKPVAHERICPDLVAAIARRYPERAEGVARLYDLRRPLPAGPGR